MKDVLAVLLVLFVMYLLYVIIRGCFSLKAWNPKKPKKCNRKK